MRGVGCVGSMGSMRGVDGMRSVGSTRGEMRTECM